MSRKTPLTSQTRKVCIVIRKGISIPLAKIKEYCNNEFERYAFIEHKGDIKPDTGEVESCHYHIVGDFIGSKVALSTRLNTLAKFFKFDNLNGIEIEQYRTFEGALQYLTHKNQPTKTPHDKKDIIHNLSDSDFNIFYEANVGEVITAELVITICSNCNNIVDVIKEIGFATYCRYRSAIWDIWNCLNGKEECYKK